MGNQYHRAGGCQNACSEGCEGMDGDRLGGVILSASVVRVLLVYVQAIDSSLRLVVRRP